MGDKKRGRPKKENGVLAVLDLGTETSLMGVLFPDGRYDVLNSWEGEAVVRTAIAFVDGDPETPLYGAAALRYGMRDAANLATLTKRVRGQKTPLIIDKYGVDWLGEMLETLFIQRVIAHITEITGMKVEGLLVTVPACFNDEERRATIDIVEQAGVKCIGTINEPTCALLGYLSANCENGNFLVFDGGGGTFDLSAMSVENGTLYTTLSTAGKTDAAGREMSLKLYDLCVNEIANKGIVLDPENDLRDMVILKSNCEDAKKLLSSQDEVFISSYVRGQLVDIKITRDQYEEAIKPILDGIRALGLETMEMAKLRPEDFDGVVLAGGASRTPAIRRLIEEMFTKEKVLSNVDPDKAIILGGAESLKVKITEQVKFGNYNYKDISNRFNLKGETELREILGHDIGVCAENDDNGEDQLAAILDATTPIPSKNSKLFCLVCEGSGKTNVKITLLQGKAGQPAKDAHVLAELKLEGLPPGPSANRIEVYMEIDNNAIIETRAVDTISGIEVVGKVDAKGALAKVV